MKKMTDTYSYIALLSYEEDGIAIDFPDLPGCCPCADKGDTAGAIKNAKEALGVHLYGMEQDGDTIPSPTDLYDLQIESGEVPILIEVFMPPVRDRIKNRFVKKTLSLPAWLADQADEKGVNCSKVFQNALMEYLNISSQRDLIRAK